MHRLGLAILLLQLSGVVLAPLILHNIIKATLRQEGMYDRESRRIMLLANGVGIVLAVAWFFWSAAFLWRLLAAAA